MSGSYRERAESELAAMTEDELLAQLLAARGAGDRRQAALVVGSLVHGRIGHLKARARLKVPSEAVAEDVAANAIESALRAILRGESGFRGHSLGEFMSWVNTMLDRRVVDYFRAQEREVVASSVSAGSAEGEAATTMDLTDHEDPIGYLELIDACERVRETMPARQRRVIQLWQERGLPAGEIAALINGEQGPGGETPMTVANVHQITHRYRTRLNEALGRAGDG